MTSSSEHEFKDALELHEHVLHRPDTYVGSVILRQEERDVVTANDTIEPREIEICNGLERIFIEPLYNMIDNHNKGKQERMPSTQFRVNIDVSTGLTTFINDGKYLEIKKHPQKKCYYHTLYFGQLLTGSNYNDQVARTGVSGRNGYGIKLTNIYSTSFYLEAVDPKAKKKFSQQWTNNMFDAADPVVVKTNEKKAYTCLKFIPDFKRFGIEGYTPDIIALFKRLLYETAAVTGVPVFFNDVQVPVNNFIDYALLHNGQEASYLHIKTSDSDVVVMAAQQGHHILSYANGNHTPLGGCHVNAWVKDVLQPVVDKYKKKYEADDIKVTMKDIKPYFRFFISVEVDKPTFDTQSKFKLESPPIQAHVKKCHINTILSWPELKQIDSMLELKKKGQLNVLERKKKYEKVDSLSPANNAGGPHSAECSLILVEGLSAKSYAVKGIDVGVFGKTGRDWFGIYALRGKNLNTRKQTNKVIAANRVIGDIVKSMNFKLNLDYRDDENFKTLHYGRILIITDADNDGIHICGLLMNAIHHLFPTVLQRPEPFLHYMPTPIVRVDDDYFYDQTKYLQYVRDIQKSGKKKKINFKYFKGLGTNSDEDIVDTFGRKIIKFVMDEKTDTFMDYIFADGHENFRKQWLQKYNQSNTLYEWNRNEIEETNSNISDFLNLEFIKFSHNDCQRSISHLMDGLKESQRKVLYTVFKRKLKYTSKELKVSQLAASVAEMTNYHHGDNNLQPTIINMACSYVGSNNIPLLYEGGQFGTRLQGGKDAAAGRYIFTKMEQMTRLLFRPEDDVLLNYRSDDGDTLEPYFYVPILPMILINGAAGIGTGWSTSVPNHNPLDVVKAVKAWIKHGSIFKPDFTSYIEPLHPWYREFKGRIVKTAPARYASYGIVERKSKNTATITELPLCEWTDNYENDVLEPLRADKHIKDFRNYSSAINVRFDITEKPDGIICNEENFKLKTTIATSNMCLMIPDAKVIDGDQTIDRFRTVEEIVEEFCKIRFDYYVKRKKHQINDIQHKINLNENRLRFLQEILNGDIELSSIVNGKKVFMPTQDLVNILNERKYFRTDADEANDDENDNNEDIGSRGFSYLLRIQIGTITAEKVERLKKEIDEQYALLKQTMATSENDVWLAELNEFETVYHQWVKEFAVRREKLAKKIEALKKKKEAGKKGGKRSRK